HACLRREDAQRKDNLFRRGIRIEWRGKGQLVIVPLAIIDERATLYQRRLNWVVDREVGLRLSGSGNQPSGESCRVRNAWKGGKRGAQNCAVAAASNRRTPERRAPVGEVDNSPVASDRLAKTCKSDSHLSPRRLRSLMIRRTPSAISSRAVPESFTVHAPTPTPFERAYSTIDGWLRKF